MRCCDKKDELKTELSLNTELNNKTELSLNTELNNKTVYTTTTPTYIDDSRFIMEDQPVKKEYKIPANRPVIIYCDGVYDLFHYGHARQLLQAKSLFPNVYLMAGVHSDYETHKHKGVTVMSETERYESLRQCKYTDMVIEDAPWVITEEFINKHNIDFVAHDDAPYESAGQADIYSIPKKLGKFIPTRRTTGISTSGIITNIISNYNTYLKRQLSRGISRQDLKISRIYEQRMRLANKISTSISGIKSAVSLAYYYNSSVVGIAIGSVIGSISLFTVGSRICSSIFGSG